MWACSNEVMSRVCAAAAAGTTFILLCNLLHLHESSKGAFRKRKKTEQLEMHDTVRKQGFGSTFLPEASWLLIRKPSAMGPKSTVLLREHERHSATTRRSYGTSFAAVCSTA